MKISCHSEAKKLHIIEEVLKIDNDTALTALDGFLKKVEKGKSGVKAADISAFFGIWSKEEADEIEKIIADSCGKI
jgi:hypothetical protein